MILAKKISGDISPGFDSYTNAFIPSVAQVALRQDAKIDTYPIVQIGERVEEGQIIARNLDSNCNIHAPVPGIVSDFIEKPLPDGRNGIVLTIKLDGQFSYLGKPNPRKNWDFFNQDELVSLIASKGITNTVCSPVLLSVQLEKLKASGNNRNIILRLYDADPTCATDSFIAKAFMREIMEGIGVVSASLNPPAVYCLYDKTTKLGDSEAALRSLYNTVPLYFIPVDVSQYPCGGTQDILRIIRKFSKNTSYPKPSRNDLIIDSATAYAVYNAVILDEPVMSRFISVNGDAVAEPKIFKARIGTPIHALIGECGGLIEKPGKIIINGSLSGNTIHDFSSPVTKYTKSVTVKAYRAQIPQLISPCIRCGKCRKVCPAELRPDVLYMRYSARSIIQHGEMCATLLCSACRLCNMVCPSRLPLYQTVKQIKKSTEALHEQRL